MKNSVCIRKTPLSVISLWICASLFLLCDKPPTRPNYTVSAINSVEVTTIPLAIKTSLTASHSRAPTYGLNPLIALAGNSDNSFDIALYLTTTKQVQILSFDAGGGKTGDFIPPGISDVGSLLGFAKIPDDGSFVAGYSKTNSLGDVNFEYWITRFDKSGTQVFSTSVFGDRSKAEAWSKGEPGAASSGRIVYNPATKNIGFYCGHTMKWLPDGVRHQGGFVGFMDVSTGKYDTAAGWFFSHNFDQRMAVVDGYYCLLAHGDAYPRALGFSRWSDSGLSGKKILDVNYFTIAGATGDNTTNTQTGGFIPLPDGTFGVVFSSSIGRSGYDVCYSRLSSAGSVLSSVWLTNTVAPGCAIYPRIAPVGGNVLLAWEEVANNVPVVQTIVVDADGNALSPRGSLASVLLSPYYDFVTLPNGDIIWPTVAKSGDSLSVCRIRAR